MPTIPADAFPFCGETYPAYSPLIDAQRSINLYPERGLSSSKTQAALIGTPGLVVHCTLPTSPVRALWAGNQRLFAVGGTHVYEVFANGAIDDFGFLAGSAGAGPCQFVQGAGPSFQLLVMDSSTGGIALGQFGVIYIVQKAMPPLPALPIVFDGKALEYLDGFFVAIATPTSTVQNQVNISDFGNGLRWDTPLAFNRRTGSNDLLTQLAVINGHLWLLGQKNFEIWYNAGGTPFPFARMPGTTINKGILARFAYAKIDNTLMWLGADDLGWAVVYRASGALPVRVSTYAIESLINNQYATDIHLARAYAYQEAGHLFFVLNFPLGTVVYDLNTGQWHERAYLNPISGLMERARPDCFASVNQFLTSTQNFVGDYATGAIYKQSLAYPADNGQPIRRIRTAPHVSNQNRWVQYSSLYLDADIGTAQPALDFSNNGGKTFPRAYAAKPASTESPEDGFPRYGWVQLGRSRDRVFRVTIDSSASTICLISAYLDAAPGTEP